MALSRNGEKYGLVLSSALWLVGILISLLEFNPLDALFNVFRWWLSFKEAIEFLIVIPRYPGSLPMLFSTPMTGEQVLILMGLPTLLAWIIGLVTIYGIEDSQRIKLMQGVGVMLFWPVLGLMSTGSALKRSK